MQVELTFKTISIPIQADFDALILTLARINKNLELRVNSAGKNFKGQELFDLNLIYRVNSLNDLASEERKILKGVVTPDQFKQAIELVMEYQTAQLR